MRLYIELEMFASTYLDAFSYLDAFRVYFYLVARDVFTSSELNGFRVYI